jgi:hypothetical protein
VRTGHPWCAGSLAATSVAGLSPIVQLIKGPLSAGNRTTLRNWEGRPAQVDRNGSAVGYTVDGPPQSKTPVQTPAGSHIFQARISGDLVFYDTEDGRRVALASDPDADLSDNTTAHLIADMEALRELRGAGARPDHSIS